MIEIVPPDIDIDFLGKRKLIAIISAILLPACIIAAFVIGPNYGIDFKGGSDIILKFEDGVTDDDVRAAATTVFSDANVQRFGEVERNEFLIQTQTVSVMNEQNLARITTEIEKLGEVRIDWSAEQPDRLDLVLGDGISIDAVTDAIKSTGLAVAATEGVGDASAKRFVVRFQDLSQMIRESFKETLGDRFNPDEGLSRLESVGPRVGEQLRTSGMLSLLACFLFMLIYIAFRFDMRYAPAAILGLVHDIIIVVGIVVAIRMEVNLTTVAALLAIVGYSINDTIVVFDRIREQLASVGSEDLEGVVNRAINETLSRTVNTSITTLLAVTAIFMFGGGLIKDFAFMLICGVCIGSYSSIFVCAPMMVKTSKFLDTRRKSNELLQA